MARAGWVPGGGNLVRAGAITVAVTRPGTSPGSSRGSGTAQGGTGAPASVGSALGAVATARKQAAAWVAQQVNPDEIIGCDPIMCAALEAAHLQANRLLMLGPNQPDPLGSEILMDTGTLRSQFGSRLNSVYAPVSLAAFGSGAALVEVRVFAPDGAHAYLTQLAADVAARKSPARRWRTTPRSTRLPPPAASLPLARLTPG